MKRQITITFHQPPTPANRNLPDKAYALNFKNYQRNKLSVKSHNDENHKVCKLSHHFSQYPGQPLQFVNILQKNCKHDEIIYRNEFTCLENVLDALCNVNSLYFDSFIISIFS